ncbi:MAG: 30S ribosomal protein S8 [Promethearchaeota archaeon]
MLHDPLADACSVIKNAEHAGKRTVVINPASKVIGFCLRILQANGYIGEYEFIDDGRTGKFKVQLLGRVNEIKKLRRQAIKVMKYEEIEKKYLPAINFGLIIVTTPKGIMTHTEAKKRNLGGRLLMYVY